MELGEAIWREITGRSPRAEITSFGDAVNYLLGRAGSASAAARVIGVPPSTFRHWVSSGRVPKGERKGDVIEMASLQKRRDMLPRGREKRMRKPDSLGTAVKCVISISPPREEERELELASWLGYDVENDLIDAYLEGATPDDLAEIFHDAIEGSAFYSDVFDSYGGYDVNITDLGWR